MSDKNLPAAKAKQSIVSLDLSATEIDITHLPPESQIELQKYAAMKKIDIQAAAQEMQLDLQTTQIAVGNMAETTRKMSVSGDSVTVRQTIENKAGKTEILMGNTDEAKSGNVDRENNTWMYVIGGIVLLLVVASVVGG